jgi:hypothetical protein
MSDEYPRLTLSLLGKLAVRVSLVMMLSFTFTVGWAALTAADPGTAAEMMRGLTVVTVAGVGIDVLSPFVIVLIAWSVAPFVKLCAYRARITDEFSAEDTA